MNTSSQKLENGLEIIIFPKRHYCFLITDPGHPCEELATEDKCLNVCLPSNCTSLIQLMDQHILQFGKHDYKKKLLLMAISKNQPI